ncbi:hypothetical protein GCM10009304_23130 [Pseudomonas matsuisoli]|uniref:Uncharacterized protein n=1 Tax=Pseudomonas matsuisoli TaxID=1515666 RepID=A0A917PWK5_9PSED|nr:hypothetical protein GCM10009304_23130 [Pseudomonas matsuisoli]
MARANNRPSAMECFFIGMTFKASGDDVTLPTLENAAIGHLAIPDYADRQIGRHGYNPL